MEEVVQLQLTINGISVKQLVGLEHPSNDTSLLSAVQISWFDIIEPTLNYSYLSSFIDSICRHQFTIRNHLTNKITTLQNNLRPLKLKLRLNPLSFHHSIDTEDIKHSSSSLSSASSICYPMLSYVIVKDDRKEISRMLDLIKEKQSLSTLIIEREYFNSCLNEAIQYAMTDIFPLHLYHKYLLQILYCYDISMNHFIPLVQSFIQSSQKKNQPEVHQLKIANLLSAHMKLLQTTLISKCPIYPILLINPTHQSNNKWLPLSTTINILCVICNIKPAEISEFGVITPYCSESCAMKGTNKTVKNINYLPLSPTSSSSTLSLLKSLNIDQLNDLSSSPSAQSEFNFSSLTADRKEYQNSLPSESFSQLKVESSLDQNISPLPDDDNPSLSPSSPHKIYIHDGCIDYYDFLNTSNHPIFIKKTRYKTVEHYFQSQKYLRHKEIYQLIMDANSIIELNKLTNLFIEYVDEKFIDQQNLIMQLAVGHKFVQYPELTRVLLDTGDSTIIYQNGNDTYWGLGMDGKGENHLGNIIMKIREQIHQEQIKILENAEGKKSIVKIIY